MEDNFTGTEGVLKRHQGHVLKKKSLGARVQVLRVLVRNYYLSKKEKYTEYDFIRHCEAVLDNTLVKYSYDLENIISLWANVSPSLKDYPITCKNCGYRPPFCGCHLR
jgi:hypothetical protein